MPFTYLLGSSTAGSTGGAINGGWTSLRGHGRDGTVFAWGTWNSSVMTVQVLPFAASTQVFNVAGSTMTADGYVNFTIEGHAIRATHTAGSTAASTSLRVGIYKAD